MKHAFPCGTLPLDFVGTLRARRNPEPQEVFRTPDVVGAWLFVLVLVPTAGLLIRGLLPPQGEP